MEQDLDLFPTLARPPIVEVVCGVVFDSIPDLDALRLGLYWNTLAAEYPKPSLQPALSEGLGFTIGAFPLRAFLVSNDEQFVLQVQHDRFFLNWRARGAEYPRFSNRHGEGGLLPRTLREFDRLGAFVGERFGQPPVARRVELAKIDVLRRGEHWADEADLADLVPAVGRVFAEAGSPETTREVQVRFVDRAPNGDATFASVALSPDSSALRIEVRHTAALVGDLEASFNASNTIVNRVFFRLIPQAEQRFGLTEAP